MSRTLTMAARDEVTDLAPKLPGSSGPNITKRLFNAFLVLNDATGAPRPYLAQALPELNTDTWRVSPDGRMETRYVLRAMSKYPPDERQAERLMGEAGFTRDRVGLFADASGKRFGLDLVVSSGPENERSEAILSDSWHQAGFDVHPAVLSQADARDPSSRHTFSGLQSRGGGLSEKHFITSEIGSAANRWSGDNRSGWTNPDYERLWTAFNSTLDLNERRRDTVQMMALVTEQLPFYPLYFTIMVRTWVASLTGPDEGTTGFGLVSSGTTVHWNVHEWEFR